MPAGRPSTYKPEYCEKIVALGEQGKFEAAWCVACNVSSKQTLHEWKEKYPEFGEAFARARLACESWWDNQTQTTAATNEGNGNLIKFIQATAFGKRETTEVINTMQGVDGSPIKTETMVKVEFVKPEHTAT